MGQFAGRCPYLPVGEGNTAMGSSEIWGRVVVSYHRRHLPSEVPTGNRGGQSRRAVLRGGLKGEGRRLSCLLAAGVDTVDRDDLSSAKSCFGVIRPSPARKSSRTTSKLSNPDHHESYGSSSRHEGR